VHSSTLAITVAVWRASTTGWQIGLMHGKEEHSQAARQAIALPSGDSRPIATRREPRQDQHSIDTRSPKLR